MTTAQSEARRRLVGIALIIFSAAMFGVVDGLSKVLNATAGPAQIVWARYALALPVLLLRVRPKEYRQLFTTRLPRLQIARGLSPLVVSFGMVFGVKFLPLADATVILFAAPLLIVALSGPFLGEHVRRDTWYAVAVGFIAVIIVARPGFSALSQYAIFPLVGAVFYAILQLLTRRLSAAGEPPVTTLAWTLATGAIVVTPVAILLWQPVDGRTWVLLFALGIAFGVSQLTMIAGLARVTVGLAAPLIYVQIISAIVFGLLVFHEAPDLWTLFGILLIIGAGLYVVRPRR